MLRQTGIDFQMAQTATSRCLLKKDDVRGKGEMASRGSNANRRHNAEDNKPNVEELRAWRVWVHVASVTDSLLQNMTNSFDRQGRRLEQFGDQNRYRQEQLPMTVTHRQTRGLLGARPHPSPFTLQTPHPFLFPFRSHFFCTEMSKNVSGFAILMMLNFTRKRIRQVRKGKGHTRLYAEIFFETSSIDVNGCC